MTRPDDALPPHDPDDLLAAEYALGALDAADRARVEHRAGREPAFAARLAWWEGRLAPLAEALPPVPPPDLMPAIEARLFGRPAARPPRWRFWAGAAGGLAVAAAAGVALTLLFAPPPPGPGLPALTVTLAAADGALVFAARWDAASATLTVTRAAGPAATAGQDYQLWIIRGEAPPEPLGLVRDEALVAALPGLAPGMTLAISLEPLGGSPTGLPTGPVLAAAVVSDA